MAKDTIFAVESKKSSMEKSDKLRLGRKTVFLGQKKQK